MGNYMVNLPAKPVQVTVGVLQIFLARHLFRPPVDIGIADTDKLSRLMANNQVISKWTD